MITDDTCKLSFSCGPSVCHSFVNILWMYEINTLFENLKFYMSLMNFVCSSPMSLVLATDVETTYNNDRTLPAFHTSNS